MTVEDRARGAGAASLRLAVSLALAACLLLPDDAGAQQASPFESSQRGEVGTGFGQTPMERGLVFLPRVDTALQYVDNLTLAGDGQGQVNTWGLELAPGFYASYSTDSVTAAIDYSVVGRAWDDSDYNDVSQVAAANGRWIAVPDLFYIDAQGSISDAVINPADGVNYGGLGIFGPSNLSQQAVAGITPTFDKQFGDFNFLAQYSYGRVWYFDEGDNATQVGFLGQDDSRDQSAYLSVGNSNSGRKFTGSLFYSWQRTDYDNALPYKYEQLGTNLTWEVTPTTSLVGTVGVESDLDKSTTQGGLDSSYWDAGVRWEPDDRTSLEARYGDRFFGSTYFLSARRATRRLEFTASYSESPEVETSILSLGSFNPGELPPGGGPGFDFGRFNSQPFVGKSASAGVAAIGSRTRVSLTGYQYVQDYIRVAADDDTQTGGILNVNRQLASNLSTDFSASYVDNEQSQLVGNPGVKTTTSSYDTTLVARLNRSSEGQKITTSLEAGYLNSAGASEYDGWWVGLRLRWQP